MRTARLQGHAAIGKINPVLHGLEAQVAESRAEMGKITGKTAKNRAETVRRKRQTKVSLPGVERRGKKALPKHTPERNDSVTIA